MRKVYNMFNIGDKVLVKIYGENREGTVVNIIHSDGQGDTLYGLRMNEPSPLFHSLRGLIEHCRGWYASEENLKLVEEQHNE